MASRKDDIAKAASENTAAMNPMVGLSREDVVGTIGSIASGAIRHPFTVMEHAGHFGRGLAEVLVGRNKDEPHPKDKRFADDAWRKSPIHKRLYQSWAVMAKEVEALIEEFDLEETNHTRAQVLTSILTDALAPSNSVINPAVLKRAIDTGGLNFVSGLNNLANDIRKGNALPEMVDTSKFKVGENIAVSKGAVVHRTDMLELIQYAPTTETVKERPILFVPPQINKYYVLDLAPGRSLIEFLTNQGFTVFTVSWFNPSAWQGSWGLDAYVGELVDVIGAVCEITGQDKINISGGCSGGITTAMLLSHLAAKGDERINAVSFWVCALDPRPEDSEFNALLTDRGIEMARARSAKKGVLTGKDLATVFAWLRPNDLIWNYVINNYLMGRNPPAFDILFWNQDSTNLTAQLHSDYLDLYVKRPFLNPGAMSVCNTPVDLGKVEIDSLIIAGTTDHITPWKACYRATQMIGGKTEFLLSNSGHIQSIINTPDNPKAKYFANPKIADTADQWLEGAHEVKGTWWLRLVEWLGERSGADVPAPQKPGSDKFKVRDEAPGRYVLG